MSLRTAGTTALGANARGARRVFDIAFSFLFCGLLLGPFVDQLVRPSSERDPRQAELRDPAPFPAWPDEFLGGAEFTRGLKLHYADTMGLRDFLLRWRNIVQWMWIGASSAESLDRGPTGWAFYAGDGTRDVYRGLHQVGDSELGRWVEVLAERRDACARVGAKYLFVLCPSKEVIYPERAPATWKPVGPSRLEQFAQRLAREPSIPFLDLRPAFLAAKSEDTLGDWLYYEYGTHWNGRGVYVAYRAILERLREDFPELETRSFEELTPLVDTGSGDSLGRQIYIDDLLGGAGYGLGVLPPQYEVMMDISEGSDRRVISNGPKDRPRLVWFHDSFGPYLQPLLFTTFSYTSARSTFQFLSKDVFQEVPDIVLETFVDRSLYILPPIYAVDLAGSPASRSQLDGAVLMWSLATSPSKAMAFGESEVHADNGVLRARSVGGRAGLLLPPQTLSAKSVAILEITADVETLVSFDVFVRPVGDAEFRRRNRGWGRAIAGNPTTSILLPEMVGQYETLIRWLGVEEVEFQRIVLWHAPQE